MERDEKKRKAEADDGEREKKEKKVRRDSSSSSSSDSSSSSSSSSSSDSDSSVSSREEKRRKKEKKDKKEKKVRKESKKEKKKKDREEKKKKKDKKKKEKKDKKKDAKKKKNKHKEDPSRSGAVTEQYGKFGIIEETDMWRVRPEFGLWLLEVKQQNIEHLSPFEEKQLFRDFMEDYNTATLPHRKFYSLETYENERQMKAANKKAAPAKAAPMSFDDTRARQEEINRIREQRKQEALMEARKNLDIDKIESMRRQKELKHQMETLFKMGNHAEAAKIQRMLLPEE